ncbi:MAG: DUF1320 domain-containing protein [Alphaproteobacteria bacterium]|nr:DUF1320 domain-containing protein [Alphaproteobacteria bacterium]
MPYATANDLIERYGEAEVTRLSDRAEPPAGVFDQAVVEAAIGDASHTIDGYLSARYALPLATVPPLVVVLACQMARYRLHQQTGAAELPEAVQADYRDAVRQLDAIGAGRMRLDVAGAEPPASGGGLKVVSSPRVFGAAGLRGWVP